LTNGISLTFDLKSIIFAHLLIVKLLLKNKQVLEDLILSLIMKIILQVGKLLPSDTAGSHQQKAQIEWISKLNISNASKCAVIKAHLSTGVDGEGTG